MAESQKAPLQEGDKAPDFRLPADGGGAVALSGFRGRPVILYFYPKDDTPGCTQESCDFRDNLAALDRIGAQVIGLSRDSVKKHDKFKKKYNLNFPLAADEDGEVCNAYGAWVEKSLYGKKYMGIDRSTFLIDGDGIIRKIWRKVKVSGHVDEVMREIEALRKAA
jgi:peroxiredoxin Q/BCP